jgi:hypothetical protein
MEKLPYITLLISMFTFWIPFPYRYTLDNRHIHKLIGFIHFLSVVVFIASIGMIIYGTDSN